MVNIMLLNKKNSNDNWIALRISLLYRKKKIFTFILIHKQVVIKGYRAPFAKKSNYRFVFVLFFLFFLMGVTLSVEYFFV